MSVHYAQACDRIKKSMHAQCKLATCCSLNSVCQHALDLASINPLRQLFKTHGTCHYVGQYTLAYGDINVDYCFAATLVDVIGSAAIMTLAEHSGLSLQISIDYLSELPGNEECEAIATVSHLGKSTATANVDLRVKRTGRLAARGTHVKFLANGLPTVRSKL